MKTFAISYSMQGACDVTGYSRSYIYLAIKAGELKAFKRGHRTFILHDELERLIKKDAG